MRLSISEILKKTQELKAREEKIAWLRKNDGVTLRTVLKYMYDPSIKCLLPPGMPPYKPSQFPDSQGVLYAETKRLRIFYEGNGYDNLNQLKREALFIGLLENLDAEDSKLVVDMKDKKSYKGITKRTVREAFPDLLPPETETENG